MPTLSRRSMLLTGTSAGLMLGASDWLTGAAAQTAATPQAEAPSPSAAAAAATPQAAAGPYTRYSATSPQGKAALKLYAQAVDIMTNKIAKGDPRHWDFQWYTHWIPGPQQPWSTVAAHKASTIQSVYAGKPTTDPHRRLAELTWDSCQAHGVNPNQPDYFQEQFFLPWHRYYVYYFEHIIRGVLQNPDFALPYWDYLGPAPASASIPEEFRSSTSPLYRSNRNAGVNAGQPVDVGPGRSPLSSAPFKETLYIDSPDGSIGFCSQLDANPHGALHVDVGTGTNMGGIPYAAGDPIFWLHHCQVDRLWESWNRLPSRRNPSWPARSFVFANAAGGQVTAPVAGADRVALLGYQYDNYYQPAGIPTTEVAATTLSFAASRPLEVRAIAPTAVQLSDAPVRTSLALPAPVGGARTLSFEAPAAQRELYLSLGGITLDADPGDVVYEVYIDLPADARPNPEDPHYVGTLNFFHISRGHDHGAESDTGAHHSTAVFNVTEAVQKLQGANQLSTQATVSLIPSGKLKSDAKPVIARVELLVR